MVGVLQLRWLLRVITLLTLYIMLGPAHFVNYDCNPNAELTFDSDNVVIRSPQTYKARRGDHSSVRLSLSWRRRQGLLLLHLHRVFSGENAFTVIGMTLCP